MANARLEIIIEAMNLAKDELRELEKDLGKTERATDKAGSGFRSMAAAAAGMAAAAVAAGVALKQGFDFAYAGAQLVATRERFDALTDSIGAGPGVLDDLRAATRGTVSDMELVASATDFMALGLVKSREELVRLTRAAGALGMNMNQLVLTLTNQTTMRFDALGVSVDGFDERLEALKATGMDVNAAFTEAFLQQAEAQIARVGEAADSTAGEFMQLSAHLQNAFDNFKMFVGSGVEPAVAALNDAIDANKLFRAELDAGNLIVNGRYTVLVAATGETLSFAQATEMLADQERAKNAEAQRWTALAGHYVDSTVEAAEAAEALADALSFKDIDLNFGDKIAQSLSKIDFQQAGGLDLQSQFESILGDLETGDIGSNIAELMLGQTFKSAQALDVMLGNIDAEQAAENIANTLGISLEAAADYVNDIVAGIRGLDGFYADVGINVTVNGGGTGVSTAGAAALAAAGGADGNIATPRAWGGPVGAGSLYLVGERGPELFVPGANGSILNTGQTAAVAGGGTLSERQFRELMAFMMTQMAQLRASSAQVVAH